MGLFSYDQYSSQVFFAFMLFLVFKGVSGATFTLMNTSNHTVWSRSSGTTAHCGSGEVSCNGAASPVTLVEFTLGSGSSDSYDVSLVDGYNLPVMVEAKGGSGSCATTGCWADISRSCPSELRAERGNACRSACDALRKPEYCCKEPFNSSSTCKPTNYSKIFKSACPKAYSYPYDDATSTFTCTGASYTITFCPLSTQSPNATNPSSGSGSDSSVDQAALSSAMSWLANLTSGEVSPRSQPVADSKSAFSMAVSLIPYLLVAWS